MKLKLAFILMHNNRLCFSYSLWHCDKITSYRDIS